jgi:predicted Zn-dependent peptidase
LPGSQKRERVIVVPKPGLPQTVIAVGRTSVGAGDAQEWALRIATNAFGGVFGSRLNMNLREDKGYTYGARSSVRTGKGVGSLVAFTSVRADVTGPALAEVIREVSEFNTRPLTDSEFSAARDALLMSVPGSFETLGGLAGTAATLFNAGLPLERLAAMVEAYKGARAEEARAAALALFDASVFQVVLVGDPEVISAQVGSLGLGPLEVVAPPGAGTEAARPQ